MTVLQQVNFYQLVQAAKKVEKSEASSRERFQKSKLSRGASSTRGRGQRNTVVNTVVTSNGRDASIGPEETPECPHCH